MSKCADTGCVGGAGFDQFGISIQTTESNITSNQDCFKNALLLVDDAGLNVADDPASGAWLSATEAGTTKYITNLAQVEAHYSKCSETYRALQYVFSHSRVGEGNRPPGITIGLVDAGETLAEAFNRIIKCDDCFIMASHLPNKSDGTQWTATAESVEFALAVRAYTNVNIYPAVGTMEWDDLILSPNETASFTYQYGQIGKVLSVEMSPACRIQVDPVTCDPVLDTEGLPVKEDYYQPSYLGAMMIAASWGSNPDNADWSMFMKPLGGGGYGIDEGIDTQDFSNATGYRNGLLQSATRHANLFAISKYDKNPYFVQGLWADGSQFVDTDVKLEVLRRQLSVALFTIKKTAASGGTGISDNTLKQVIQTLRSQVVIQHELRGLFSNVFGDDWAERVADQPIDVIHSQPEYYFGISSQSLLTTTGINNRTGRTIYFCAKIEVPQHGVTVAICDLGNIEPIV